MNNLYNILNSREIAVSLWVLVGVFLFLRDSSVRKLFASVAKAFFAKQLTITYLSAFTYTLLGILILYQMGFWEISHLKDTIIWFLFSALVTLFKVNEADKNKNYFKDALKDNFKFSLIVEFITGIYTYNFYLEFFLVPVLIAISVSLVASERDARLKPVKNILNSILLVLGIITVVHSLDEIWRNIDDFAQYKTLKDFLLTIILALWFIPFLYVLHLYINYETVFISIKNTIKDKELLDYARITSIINFGPDIEILKRWKNRLFTHPVSSKRDILDSINEIKKLKQVEANPPVVNYEHGWSPYAAKSFLKTYGIETGYYNNNYGDDWTALSKYIDLDEEVLSNNIAYYVSGNRFISNSLKLILNVNNINNESAAIKSFYKYASLLYLVALQQTLPEKIGQAIIKRKKEELAKDEIVVSVRKEKWITEGYSLIFNIEHKGIPHHG